jgi:tetratricopeptide (TPR) repeat protein
MSEIKKETQVATPERVKVELSEDVKKVDEKIAQYPNNGDLWMERGLALAGMYLFREAVESFSKAISLDPFKGIYYRHRAHRHLSCWEFEEARADFVLASRIIPDSWDVWYHLGLSNYLLGEYEKAIDAYKVCYSLSKTDDKLIPVSDWYYMTLMRLGRREEAAKLLEPIHEGMDCKENIAYYNRLKIYKGISPPEELRTPETREDAIQWVTFTYGLSNFYAFLGDTKKADELRDKIISEDKFGLYYAFGCLAAMVDRGRFAVRV